MRDPKPEVIRQGLLFVQVCVPVSFTDSQVEEFANKASPTGIRSEWRIDRSQERVRAACFDRDGCCHLVLNC